VASAGQQRWHARRELSGIHALDAKDADVPLFQACDEVSDSRLAKVNSRQIEHHRLAGKKPGRTGKSYIYFFKPARDRNDWAKGERDERTASHPE
jgi:hypothetical protein